MTLVAQRAAHHVAHAQVALLDQADATVAVQPLRLALEALGAPVADVRELAALRQELEKLRHELVELRGRAMTEEARP